MANVTKHDLVSSVSEFTGLTQADTKIVVEEFLDTISQHIVEGETIEIRGFGTFYSRERKARPARNPKTGEEVYIGKRKIPLFKYSTEFRKRIIKALED